MDIENIHSKSLLTICGIQKHACGYCKITDHDTSISYGVIFDSLNSSDYEKLMYHGFRRSGNYVYRPIMHLTCCPAYPIRLRSAHFSPTKSQRNILKKMSSKNISISTEPPLNNPEAFDLYKRYQIAVHHDNPEDINEKSFESFLCKSPLIDYSSEERRDQPFKYGSYHQYYRLDDVLIAVGVIDILPSGVSSVYCFYDPQLKNLSLGKYTALKEIEFCNTHNFKYYYLGFYIHTCEKMKYKAEYRPSELMCPVSYEWYPLEDCTPLLDVDKFTPFHPQLLGIYASCKSDIARSSAMVFSASEDENENGIGALSVSNEYMDMLHSHIFGLRGIDMKTELDDLVNKVPLQIGQYPTLYLSQLTARGIDFLKPILTEWCEVCGLDSILCKTMHVKM